MITELEKNDLQIEEITHDIMNLGETILTLLENEIEDDNYDETLCKVDTIAKAIGKCCKELSDKSGDGLDILLKQQVTELKQREEDKQTIERLADKVIELEDYIQLQTKLLETYKERTRLAEELEKVPLSN